MVLMWLNVSYIDTLHIYIDRHLFSWKFPHYIWCSISNKKNGAFLCALTSEVDNKSGDMKFCVQGSSGMKIR